MNNRQTKKNERQSEQDGAECKAEQKRDVVPSRLNRWQYGCIKKAAGV